jgi:hypothetical protein
MKQLLLLTCIFLLACATQAQRLFPLKIEDDSLAFKIRIVNNLLVLEQQGETTLFKPKSDFPKIESVAIEESDLVLRFRSQKTGALLSDSIAVTLQMPDGSTISSRADDILILPDAHGSRRLVIQDFTELLSDFGATYTLKVRRSLMGAVNCAGERPKKDIQVRLLALTGSLGSSLSIYLGFVYAGNRNAAYHRYEQLWTEGSPRPNDQDSPLAEARKADRNAKIFFITGATLGLATPILLFVNNRKLDRKRKYYDKFCGEKNSSSFQLSPSKTGVGIVLNF